MTQDWTAVIPIKPWRHAKSRLSVPDVDREELAAAFALDTLETVANCELIERIVIVTSQPGLGSAVADLGADAILPDPPPNARDRLNAAVALGRKWARAQAPRSPIVVIPSDLSALTPGTLGAALQQLTCFDRVHVPDAHGTGTTLVAAVRPDQLITYYGPGSERAHARSGSVPIVKVHDGVRLDVDSATDLTRAMSLGLRRRSRELLAQRA